MFLPSFQYLRNCESNFIPHDAISFLHYPVKPFASTGPSHPRPIFSFRPFHAVLTIPILNACLLLQHLWILPTTKHSVLASLAKPSLTAEVAQFLLSMYEMITTGPFFAVNESIDKLTKMLTLVCCVEPQHKSNNSFNKYLLSTYLLFSGVGKISCQKKYGIE